MGDKFPRWSARNPLGIIALFISLIYGMSALLLGTSVDSLAASNQTILVYFVVSFPFVVLGVFAWFVAKHHKKLYGPADFRSDEAFHAVKDLPPAALGHRLSQETETSEVEPDEQNGTAASEQEAAPATPGTKREQRSRGPGMPRSAADRVTRAFVAEALVLQELQREFGGAIRRQVAVRLGGGRLFRVDGIINIDGGTVATEVKLINQYKNLANIINESIAQAMRYRNAFEDASSCRFILAIVVDYDLPTKVADHIIKKEQIAVGDVIELRRFSLPDLMNKYGWPSAEDNIVASNSIESADTDDRHSQLRVASERDGAR